MSTILTKILRRCMIAKKNTFMPCLCSSTVKVSEKSAEEIEIPMPWGHIAGKWWGDKSIAPVLAIHGWQDNANSFDKLIPLLNTPSVLAIDLPGHGQSSHFPSGKAYDFEEHIIMLHRIKKHFNWTEMPLLTHSFGGALGYAYASMFPDDVKWLINFECARTLMTLLRRDFPTAMSQGVDALLKIEEQKKDGLHPSYKMNQLIEMIIEGSLGSVASPKAAVTLLKRGVYEVDRPSLNVKDKISGDLADFIAYEKKAVLSLTEAEQQNIFKIISTLTQSVQKGKEAVKNFNLDKKDNKYYAFKRDPCIKVLIFQSFDEDFVIEAAKNIKCPVLSLRAKQGFLYGSTKKLYEDTLEILKKTTYYFEHHDVNGTHHAHLNNPDSLAPKINNFIEKFKPVKL